MKQNNIRNCPWGYRCERTWEDLIQTDDRSVRFCDRCQKGVHNCETLKSLANNVALNRCVNFPLRLISPKEPLKAKVLGSGPIFDFDSDIPF